MKAWKFLLLLLLLSGDFLFAQDSLSPGIVVVKRPPVPSAFGVKLIYDYSTNKKKRSRARRDGGSEMLPPQPVSVYRGEGDSVKLAYDSARMVDFRAKNDRPAKFDWNAYEQTIPHQFAWNDSLGVDSAQYQFIVPKKGKVLFVATPWPKADSSCRKLEQEALPVMRSLWTWYPAQSAGRRSKNISCTVTVIIYAYRADSEHPLPVQVESTLSN